VSRAVNEKGETMYPMQQLVVKTLRAIDQRRRSVVTLATMAFTAAIVAALPVVAFATETEAQTKSKELFEKIASEGLAIFLIAVGAVTVLIAVVISVVLGVRKIRSLVK
jgi:hypothetical protein